MTHELDAELARWLGVRSACRSRRRLASALDDVAIAVGRMHTTLGVMMSATYRERARGRLVGHAYRWAIRVARELDAIAQLDLDAMTEWTRFEAFAPFALAFFDSAVAPSLAGVRLIEAARLRRDLDAVLALLVMARTSSALAA